MPKFVSGGTADEPLQHGDAWLKAQQEIEESRRRREEQQKQEGGKSLYETLQANKAAKQEAFEESMRLKNQFRSLDDDEVEFLDSVLESTRAKEAAVRKETAERLNAFRRQREEAERAAAGGEHAGSPTDEQESWALSGKKRKKGREKETLRFAKLRKSSSTTEQVNTASTGSLTDTPTETSVKESPAAATESAQTTIPEPQGSPQAQSSVSPRTLKNEPANPIKTAGLGLGDYSSDED